MKVELKIQSPLVNSVPWGVDTQTKQSYNPFRGLHLISTPASTHQPDERRSLREKVRKDSERRRGRE